MWFASMLVLLLLFWLGCYFGFVICCCCLLFIYLFDFACVLTVVYWFNVVAYLVVDLFCYLFVGFWFICGTVVASGFG